MNEMYNMSIDIHDIGVLALIAVIAMNAVMLKNADDIKIYTRKMRIYMPFSVTMIALVLFTGAIMMAAKHLNFTVANIVMIILGVVLIVQESRRYSALKYMDRKAENALDLYKRKAMMIMASEFLSVVLISLWMLLL